MYRMEKKNIVYVRSVVNGDNGKRHRKQNRIVHTKSLINKNVECRKEIIANAPRLKWIFLNFRLRLITIESGHMVIVSFFFYFFLRMKQIMRKQLQTLRLVSVYSRDKPSQVITQLISIKMNARNVAKNFHISRDAILSVACVHVHIYIYIYIVIEPA